MLKLSWKISRIPGVCILKVYRSKDKLVRIICPDKRTVLLIKDIIYTCNYKIKAEGPGICSDDQNVYYLYITK